jgi:hypothetical protein
VGANTAYVLIAIYGERDLLPLAQLMLSLFKLFWNRFFSVYLIRWAAVIDFSRSSTAVETEFATLQMTVVLLNNIAVPCLVVAGISPNCFYNILVQPPAVEVNFQYDECIEIALGTGCTEYTPYTATISYDPPFSYNYQCSSSFITYYAPTFVLLCLMHGFAVPIGQFALYQLHRRATPGTGWFAVLDFVLLPNLKPIAPGEPAQVNVFKPFFDANQLLLSLFTYLGLLLTFGAMFPPVAVALLVTLLAVLHFNKLKISRFLSHALEQSQLDYVDAVEAESGRSGFLSTALLERAVWMLVTVSCWFYTLFLFDTLGDAVGFQRAYWVLIAVPLLPLVLYVQWCTVRSIISSHSGAAVGRHRATEVEMGAMKVTMVVNILRVDHQ